jgi:putative DNA primase/helicase
MSANLSADREQIGRFIDRVFKHADKEARISLRVFTHKDQKTVDLKDAKLGDPRLLELACTMATAAANDMRGVVFSPPVATFNGARDPQRGYLKADDNNLKQGVVLSVELDKTPTAGRQKLEEMLGNASLWVASGGTTEEGEDKLHGHWVLTEPATTEEERKLLTEARDLACTLGSGDASGKSIVHPYRWPGSWHTKRAPRLVKIVAESDNEIDLNAALKKLREAVPKTEARAADGDGTAPITLIERALAVIPNTKDESNADYWQKITQFAIEPEFDYWNKIGMATFRATSGADAGETAFEKFSQKSPRHDDTNTKRKWQAFKGCPPTKIGARTLFWLADIAATGWRGALDPRDPMRSARELVAKKFVTDGRRILHRHRAAFWSWTKSHYMLADDEVIESIIWEFLEGANQQVKVNKEWQTVPFKPNRARVGDVLAALGAVCQLDTAIEPPSWLSPSTLPANEFLACGNGLLHLPTGILHPPSSSYFNLSASEVIFDLMAPEPTQWLAFLKQLFDDDQEQIDLLQDEFGYWISPDTSQQKISLVIGPKRSGKGTIGRILSRLVGSVAGPTMSSLAETFGLEPLITKSLAIVSDARIGARTDKSAITERLLSISGEDTMTVHRKFKSAWHGRMTTRFMILTNELPSLTDGSGALAGRFVVSILTKSFFGKEDPALTNKLATELSGILNWSIEGYRRLRDRGYFVQPKSSVNALDEIETLAAPVKAFIRDLCETGPGLSVEVDILWGAYKDWCDWEGRRDAGTKTWFGRNLRTALPGLTVIYPGERGHQLPTYVGIKLKEPADKPKTPNPADNLIPL